MDSRKCSAALGFTLLMGCVMGIVIIIYNSGPTKRSSETFPVTTHYNPHVQQHHHHHRVSSTTVVGGKAAGGGSDHFGSAPKLGFANDPNYRNSQPTMQDVNQLADELRLLSSKSKHVPGSSTSPGKGNPVNTGTVTAMKKTNGSLPSTSSSATSSVKASISAVNYSSVPKKNAYAPPPNGKGSLASPPILPSPVDGSMQANSSSSPRNRPPQPLPVNALEIPLNQQQILQQHHTQKAYRGHLPPPSLPSLSTQMMVDSGERRLVPSRENKETGVGGGGKAHKDLYTTSWHPSMVSPAGGGVATSNYPYHQYLPVHPQSHRFSNNNPQPPRPSSPARINKAGKDTGYDYYPNQRRVPNSKQYQQRNQQYQQNPEKEEIEHGDYGDFVEVDVDDNEDDVYSNQGNVKKEEEGGNDNDTADNEQDEEEEEDDDEEEEEDEYDNGANPEILMEPKNLVADLETLFSLANHLYTSPTSLLSTLSAQASANSTKKTGAAVPTSGFPAAFQGFLKVINETIQRGNNSKLLVELNEKYRGREGRMNSKTANGNIRLSSNSSDGNHTKSETFATSSLVKDGGADKQQNEKSLTSFIFMSFGVFLLNQIHNFVQKTADEHLKHHSLMSNSTIVGEGRAFPWERDGPLAWYSPHNGMIMTTESSSLDILFRPPVSPNSSADSVEPSFDAVSGRSNDDPSFETKATLAGGGHLNNMFRALLNIGNAYSSDSPDMECIWSLYCKDLDQTAKKDGLYGVAARINSVGLRLIMKQIPPALTFDVILRSLVGWDGLPCRKMFPDCAVGNGTMSRVTLEEENAAMKKVVKNV